MFHVVDRLWTLGKLDHGGPVLEIQLRSSVWVHTPEPLDVMTYVPTHVNYER